MTSASPAERLRLLRFRLLRILFAGVLLVLTGVAGYMIIEGWDFFDSLYMTVITLAGVGYGETRPLDTQGRIFTIALILLGIVTLAFLVNQIVQALGEGYLQEGLKLSRRRRMLSKLKDHFIVCGYGRMGGRICEELASEGARFVIIEAESKAALEAQARGYMTLQGDASADQTLVEAGIDRARCVICALPSDADNLFIVLSARNLNPKVRTITRASSEEAAVKLRRGGADEVVSPYSTGAQQMAAIALRPGVVDFIETAIRGTNRSLYIEEFKIDQQNSPFVGRTLKEAALRDQSGALVVAIRRQDGTLIGTPTGDVSILPGDVLFCLGTSQQLRQFSGLVLPIV